MKVFLQTPDSLSDHMAVCSSSTLQHSLSPDLPSFVQNQPDTLADRHKPWHASGMKDVRKDIKRRIYEEEAMSSPTLLKKLGSELGILD